MQDFEAPCLEDRADWVRLLCAYAQLEDEAAAALIALNPPKPSKGFPGRKKKGNSGAPETLAGESPVPASEQSTASHASSDGEIPSAETDCEDSQVGWVGRIHQLDGVDPSQMSKLHGRVIALGYLKFQLIDRQIGLRYRLTPAGKQVVKSDTAEKAAA